MRTRGSHVIRILARSLHERYWRYRHLNNQSRVQAHRSLVVSMTTTWRCHRFESWLVYGDPSLGLPATLVEEIGLKIVNSHLFKSEAMFFPKKNMTYVKPEPITFSDQNHCFEYTNEFKYLGCILTPDLMDDTEIAKRVKQAKVQITNLNNFFKSRASTWVKKLVFQSIPVNTLLFCCKTWTLTDSNKKKISSVYHEGLRKVLGLCKRTRKEQTRCASHSWHYHKKTAWLFRQDCESAHLKSTETVSGSMDSETKTDWSPKVHHASHSYGSA
jgi:hypothetical protein